MHSPLEIVELHTHSDALDPSAEKKRIPFNSGTSVSYNYIDYRFIKSSRYKSSMFDKYNQLFTDNKNLFKVVFKYDNYLFSHAGITLGWLKEINLLDYKHLNKEYIDNLIPYLSKISFWRGGPDDFGSCVWADIHELFDLDMLPENIYQIFGHTQLKEPIITDKWACLKLSY